MDCSSFESVLSGYLDGDLSRDDAGLFRRHALQCRECRRLMDEVKAAISDCRTADDVESPAALEAALVMIPAEQTPIDCHGFEEIITEFLDGFVPAAAYHRFEEHAKTCDACSELLTDVVYAVAACHSVHTYEEYDVPAALDDLLLAVMPGPHPRLRTTFVGRLSAVAAFLMPRRTQGGPWSFATASILAFVSFALLIFNFSDDLSVKGIYRQARAKAAEIYSQGSDIYAEKDEVVGRLHEVRSDIGEIWNTLGGPLQPDRPQETADQQSSSGGQKRDASLSSDGQHK